jgi:hypothetical protein
MKFKSDIEVQAGLRDGGNDIGTAGQILSSTGSQTNWIDQSSIVASESKLVVIECKNTSGVTISKGTPVYQTGTVGATDVIEIDAADASDEDKMAAIGLLQTDLVNNAFGKVVITGELLNITTSPIDGVTPVTGDTIYVKSGGGLTLTKPTGVNFIQNIGLVGKVSGGSAGSITVSSIMRSNDVPTPLYIDHANQRLGIGVTSPGQKLDVNGNANIDGTLFVNTTNNHIRLVDTDNTGNFSVGVNTNFQIRDITANTTPLTIRAGTPGNTILTTSSGRVGIGLSSPGVTLHVNGFARLNGGLQMNATNATIYQILDSDLRFGTNNTERMRIDNTGNVGIGTTSPSAKLEVNGQTVINSTGLTEGFQWFNDTNEIFSLEDTSGAGELLLLSSNSVKVKLNANGTSYFNGGNVGIGTSSPASKLDVVGTGSFTGQVTIPATPVASTDAASKSYVDNSVAAIITPAAPSTVTSTIVGETIEIEFNESATSDIDYYQVWSSDDGGDYGIIGQITSDDFSSTMTVVDTTFVTGGTMSYRIYAVRQGVYSAAATTSKSYTVSALSVTNMTVVNLNTAYYIQYEKPNSRFIDHIEIYMDSQTTLAALNRSNATLVYSGQNASYMRSVGTSSNFHQFWVEVVAS